MTLTAQHTQWTQNGHWYTQFSAETGLENRHHAFRRLSLVMDSKMQVCVGILEIYLELYISVKLRKALYKKKTPPYSTWCALCTLQQQWSQLWPEVWKTNWIGLIKMMSSRSDHKATLTHSLWQTLRRSNISWFYLYASRTHFSLKARLRRSLWNFLSAKAKRYFIGFKNWQKITAQ